MVTRRGIGTRAGASVATAAALVLLAVAGCSASTAATRAADSARSVGGSSATASTGPTGATGSTGATGPTASVTAGTSPGGASGPAPSDPGPSASASSPPAARPDPLAAPAEALLAAGARSVSVAVARPGAAPVARAYGPGVDTSSRYRIASISKTVTDLAALRLAAQGRLDPHAPLAPTLRAMGFTVSPAFARLTVDELETHTAGFGTMVDYPQATCRAYVQRILAGTPAPPIGTYSYSNHDHCLLGLVLEHVTGVAYATLVQQLVWQPAGVTDARLATDSGTFLPGDATTATTTAYGGYLADLGAGAAWMASPSDLVAVVRSMTVAERAAMRASPNGQYGHGIMFAGPAWGHTGSIWGAAACLWVEPDGTVWAVTAATPGTSVHGGDLRARFLPAVRSV